MNTTTPSQNNRIRKELIAAGMSAYGLRKAESKYLPELIHKDEHIGGVVYGRYEGGSGMLIATDRRVIFLDKKPLFTTNDEVTYSVISGFKISRTGLINAITLHTRVKDFNLKYVNQLCATKFKSYLESRSLEENIPANSTKAPASKSSPLTTEALVFLRGMDIGVLSTSDKKGVPHGAVTYYVVDLDSKIHILTKADTTKAQNVIANTNVALTVFNAEKAQTLQLQGSAAIETDEVVKRRVFDDIMKPHKYNGGYKLPPVAWLEAGMFVIITITPKSTNYSDFSKKNT